MNWKLLSHAPLLFKRRRLIPKLIRNYKKLIFDRQPVLRTIDFSTTFECTCRCDHCYVAPLLDRTRPPLDLSEKKRVIDQALSLGAVAVNFLGGEPLCDPDLLDLVAHVPPNEAVPVVTTNAVGLDEAMLDKMIEAGLGILAVSIDEVDPAAHDAFRHFEGAFQKAMDAVATAEKRGLECVINSMLTSEKLLDGRAAALVELARRYNAHINIALPVPVGRRASHGQEHLPPKAQLAVTAYGDVLPCGAIQLSFGNVRDMPLRAAWENMLRYPRFQKIRDGCPVSEDPEFIERVLRPIQRAGTPPPVPAKEVLGDP